MDAKHSLKHHQNLSNAKFASFLIGIRPVKTCVMIMKQLTVSFGRYKLNVFSVTNMGQVYRDL